MVIVLNGERINCPGKNEITLGEYQKIYTLWGDDLEKDPVARDYFRLFCILTNKNFVAYVPTKENEQSIWLGVKWVFETFPEVSAVSYGGKEYKLTRVNDLSIGQAIAIRQRLEKFRFVQQGLSIALAVFLQPLVDGGPLKLERVEEIEKELSNCKAADLHAPGFFLLNQWSNFGQGSTPVWKQIKINLKRGLGVLFQNLQTRKNLSGSTILP